ncbi:MAG: flagellar biosynthesis anti-sigma factor FlgM [Actinomycetota bacterium]
MPNKINIDKISEFSPIRAISQSDIKKASGETNKPVEVKKANNEDKLDFSSRASEVGKLVEQLKSLPDVREEKINQLREQVATGKYNPSSSDIAAAILKDENI